MIPLKYIPKPLPILLTAVLIACGAGNPSPKYASDQEESAAVAQGSTNLAPHPVSRGFRSFPSFT